MKFQLNQVHSLVSATLDSGLYIKFGIYAVVFNTLTSKSFSPSQFKLCNLSKTLNNYI